MLMNGHVQESLDSHRREGIISLVTYEPVAGHKTGELDDGTRSLQSSITTRIKVYKNKRWRILYFSDQLFKHVTKNVFKIGKFEKRKNPGPEKIGCDQYCHTNLSVFYGKVRAQNRRAWRRVAPFTFLETKSRRWWAYVRKEFGGYQSTHSVSIRVPSRFLETQEDGASTSSMTMRSTSSSHHCSFMGTLCLHITRFRQRRAQVRASSSSGCWLR